jgi:hypothetical protein
VGHGLCLALDSVNRSYSRTHELNCDVVWRNDFLKMAFGRPDGASLQLPSNCLDPVESLH